MREGSGNSQQTQSRRMPEATVVRLPVYQRILGELLRTGVQTVSSEKLATMARVNAAKVRKDLSLLGSFGTRGTGYDVGFLKSQIDRAFGVDQDWPLAIIGIGHLGRALANSDGFSSRGFRVSAMFDIDPSVIGEEIGPGTVRHVDDLGLLPESDRPIIGVIATPAGAAQDAAERLVAIGVDSILNFAPEVLHVSPEVFVRYVDLSIELQVISFYHRDSPYGESPSEEQLRGRTREVGDLSDSDALRMAPLRSLGLTPINSRR